MNHSDTHPLISLDQARVTLGSVPALAGVTWDLDRGAHWAVIGPNGSGKSTFLRLVRGELHPDQKNGGQRIYRLAGSEQRTPIGLRQRMGLVSSELQERYLYHEWNIPALSVVLSGFFDTPLLYESPTPGQQERARRILALLGIEELADRPFLSLSQGQARKVLLARALAPLEPAKGVNLLLLDEPCSGLDQESRDQFLALVKRVAAGDEPEIAAQVLMADHRLDRLPGCLTHAALFSRGSLVRQGPLAEVLESPEAARAMEPKPPAAYCPTPARPGQDRVAESSAAPIFEIRNAQVFLDRVRVLKDLNWKMLPGENWAVLGPNGSGKTTLLKLLAGDLHPALGGEIFRFGLPEPCLMELVWKRLGMVSPDLQSRYRALWGRVPKAWEAAASNFNLSMDIHREIAPQEEQAARYWLDQMGLAEFADRPVDKLSYGQMRRVLLARALAPDPELLILDEPCSGLDRANRALLLDLVSELAQNGRQLLYVTHDTAELVPEITHVLRLDQGRIVSQGPRKDMEK